jgi:hypothetical protein
MAVLETAVKKVGSSFDIIAVSGDLVDYTVRNLERHRNVLKNTHSYLVQFANEFCINKTKGLVIIPGNHDYRWRGVEANADAEEAFKDIYRDYFGHRLFVFGSLPPLLVACFDSNRQLEGGNEFDWARGALDIQAILRDLNEINDVLKDSDVRRIALVHHNPLPVTEAERIDLRGIFERVLGKQLGGAAEYMLLRNSGVFLQTLIDNNFRMALHGHLHKPGFWRAHGTTSMGHASWIEVLSAPSVFQGEILGFNTIEFSSDGVAEVRSHEFTRQGPMRLNRLLPSAEYDVIRGVLKDPFERAPKVSFDLYSETYVVDLDNGDLECIELRKGIRSTTSEPQDSFNIRVTSAALTMTVFDAWDINSNNLVSADPIPADEEGWMDFGIRLDPAATDHAPHPGVFSRFVYRSVMYSSKEDKLFCGDDQDPGFDMINETVSRPADRMVIKVRFITKHSDRIPKHLSFEVKRPTGARVEEEEQSGYVHFDWLNPSLAAHASTHPEAVLTVFKPRPGFDYKIKWALRGNRSLVEPRTKERWAEVYRLSSNPRKCQDALFQALDTLKKRCAVTQDISAYLFAFNSDSCMLEAISSAAPARNDQFAAKAFRYGHDVVGAAFRLARPLFYMRDDPGTKYFRRLKPDDLEFLLGCPILSSADGLPLACVAVASRQRGSHVRVCGEEHLKEVADDVSAAVAAFLQLS